MRRGPKEEGNGAPLRCGESVQHHWIRASSAAGSPLFVVRPGDVSWDEARSAWNLAVDQRPAAVVLPESAADVVETVRFARARSSAGKWARSRLPGRPLGCDPAADDAAARRHGQSAPPQGACRGRRAVAGGVRRGRRARARRARRLLARRRRAWLHARMSKLHMDPPAPAPGIGDGFMLGELDAAAIEAVVASAGADSGSTLLSVELRHLGGALGRTAEGRRGGTQIKRKSIRTTCPCRTTRWSRETASSPSA
jgi:hypothetical protein